jgi:hypothetical protein
VIVMGRHSISRSPAGRWARRLPLIVGGAGLLVLAGVEVRWALRTPTHEVLTSGRFGFLLALVSVVLIVLIAIGVDSAVKRRYADRPFPAIPAYFPGPPGLAVPRRVVRRWSGFAYLMMAIIAGLPVSIVIDWNTHPAAGDVAGVTAGAALLAGCWLAGPACRFVVTREYLHIDTAFRRTSLPRQMLAGFDRGAQEVRAGLTDGDSRDFRVDTPLLDLRGRGSRSNERCQFRTVEAIVRALGEVPPVDSAYPVVATHDRSGPVAVAVGAVVIAAIVATLLA